MQPSPLLPTSLQWRPFAAPTTTHFQKMFALEGPLHQYCPRDSTFRIGMWVPALETCAIQAVQPAECVTVTAWEKASTKFTEEHSTQLEQSLLSAPTRKAWSKYHLSAALFCHGCWKSLKLSSFEVRHCGVTQWTPRRPSWDRSWCANTTHHLANLHSASHKARFPLITKT